MKSSANLVNYFVPMLILQGTTVPAFAESDRGTLTGTVTDPTQKSNWPRSRY
jgi:hypothetical protein